MSTAETVVELAKSPPEAQYISVASAYEQPAPFTDALLTYCRSFGKLVSREDFLIGLPITGDDLADAMALRALDRVGLDGTFRSARRLKPKFLPCCAAMKDSSYLVVLERDKEFSYVADLDAETGKRAIPAREFDAGFSGRYLKATVQIDDIQRRHVGTKKPQHWFWGRFSGQRGLVRDIILGTFVANILAVAIALFALQVYDRVIPNQSEATLWVLVAGAGVAIFCEALLRVSRAHLMDVAGRRIELSVTSFLFSKLMGMSLSKRPASPGALAYLMREFSSVREFFTAASIGSVADIPFVFVFLLLIYGIAGNVVWIIVAGMALIILPSLLMRKTMTRLSEEMQGGTSAASKLLTEVCYNHDTIKSHGGEALFQRRWEEIVALNAQKTSQQRLLASALTFWSVGVQHAAYVLAVVAGVYMVFAGDFTIGTIIAVSILSSRSIAPITQLSGTIARWEQVKTALTGLEQIAEAEQDRGIDRTFARKANLTGDIILQGTEFAYEQNPPSLRVTKLEILENDRLCLLGRNGSGKSTLLKVLSGLYACSSGSVTIGGLDIRQVDPVDLRRNIGYLPQEVRLFSGTLRENLTMGQDRFSEEKIIEAVTFSGLDFVIRAHPLGLDLPIADGGEGLSVGQRHSVGLARIYLQDPKIVLLDEPTASLDQNAEKELIGKLDNWLKGKTCVLTTHRMGVLSIVNKVAVLANGGLSMHGSRDEVVKKLQTNSGKGAENVAANAAS
ncbi:MAG: type I secretion system permease/ATPase [Boseongicola sp.]